MVAQAFRMGWSVSEVHECCKIDPWFLVQIEQIVKVELEL
jgi:carbamoyl-phosphate synthase large subunit